MTSTFFLSKNRIENSPVRNTPELEPFFGHILCKMLATVEVSSCSCSSKKNTQYFMIKIHDYFCLDVVIWSSFHFQKVSFNIYDIAGFTVFINKYENLIKLIRRLWEFYFAIENDVQNKNPCVKKSGVRNFSFLQKCIWQDREN